MLYCYFAMDITAGRTLLPKGLKKGFRNSPKC